MKRCFIFAALLLATSLVSAQADSYLWDAGELRLAVPQGWDTPYPTEQDDQWVLQLAQIDADEADIRPPGAHTITLTIIPLVPLETPLDAFLTEALDAQETPPTSAPIAVLTGSGYGITAVGASADGLLYGVGHAIRLVDGRVLVITGRSAAASQESFAPLYDSVVNSIVPGTQIDSTLSRGVPVQGALSEATPQQTWTYEGTEGETITLSASDVSRIGTFDLAIRLMAPNGQQEGYNDDQLGADLYGVFDSQIPNHRLRQSGTYQVVVERVDGEGVYTLGITESNTFTLSDDGVTRLEGWLGDGVPTAEWHFDGQAGQVFNITMRATTGSLDPYLKMYPPDGELWLWNDDSADPEMGVTSQLIQVTLPANGTYTLEATRYDGAGRYTILLVATR